MLDPNRHAVLYRMVMDKHICPFGLKAKHLLESRGYTVEDHWLETREQVDAFKAEHAVKATPQTFIAGQRIGGYTDLRQFFGIDRPGDEKRESYTPVACVFLTAALIAMAASWASLGTSFTLTAAGWFVSISMMLLAMLKLQDIESFSTMFLGYDLLAQRWVPYAYLYPFLEWGAGALMTAHTFSLISIPVSLLIGGVGAASVYHAVYVQKRKLKCACVGGSANVPLGFVALVENVAMIGMALAMLAMVASGG